MPFCGSDKLHSDPKMGAKNREIAKKRQIGDFRPENTENSTCRRRLLLGKAMQGTETPDQVNGMNADNRAVLEKFA